MVRYRTAGCVAVILLCSSMVFALPGTGTAEDPYRIESPEDFNEFTADPNSLYIEAHIRLECDLDLTGRYFYAACRDYFNGVFEGNNHSIRKLRIEAMTLVQVGLFGYASNARIANLVLVDPYVSGLKQVAVVCGYAESCVIENCRITGLTMLAHQYAGGVIGKDYGSTLTNCSVAGEITAFEDFGTDSQLLGGLIGYTYDPTVVEDCATNITINPYPTHTVNSIGGLIGQLGQGTVRRCSSMAILSGSRNVGGLLGESILKSNVVEDCFAEATVSGAENVGGLIGRNGNSTAANNVGGTVRRCVSHAIVQSGTYGGGLIGYNYSGPIVQCRSDSTVSGGSIVGGLIGNTGAAIIQECRSNATVSGTQNIGGLIGISGAAVSDCYALGTASSTSSNRGGLIGSCTGGVTRCYAAVNLPGNSSSRGGLIGRLTSPGTISKCFWGKSIQTGGAALDIGTKSGSPTVTDIFGKATSEMETKATFTAYGWDFTNETTNGTADLWRLCTDGTAYPRLAWEYPRQDLACPDGVGVEDLLVLSDQWLATGLTPDTGPDFTGDGAVKLDDLAILGSVWLTTP